MSADTNKSPYNAAVIGREEINPQLLVLRVETNGAMFDFKPGQFAVLGLLGREPRVPEAAAEEPISEPDKMIRRAYSIASSSVERRYAEFYLTLITSGQLRTSKAVVMIAIICLNHVMIAIICLNRAQEADKSIKPMKSSGTVSALLHHKGSEIWSVPPETTVFEAIKLMADKNIGAVLVMSGGKLSGVFTERDYTRKVILQGKTSKETRVREICSAEVISVGLHHSVEECMKLMTEHRVRHLPVVEGEKVVGWFPSATW
jgi:CBS domain-containing protein